MTMFDPAVNDHEAEQLQPQDYDNDDYVEEPRSPRFTQWFAFFMFSLITLGSAIEASESTRSDKVAANQRWAVACSGITFLITMIVLMLHISSITALLVVGTKLEGFSIIVLIGFWSATAAVVSNSENGLAVDENGAVSFGNLYYFSWGGFICSVTLFASYLRSVYHIDMAEELRMRSARLNLWAALMVFSLIMMGSAASMYDKFCEGGDDTSLYCKRTKLAVVSGALGVVIALAMLGMKIASTTASFGCEALAGILLFFAFSFVVAFITSEDGPGAPLGNLYYSTWAAFISTFMIGASIFDEYNVAKQKRQSDRAQEQEQFGAGEVQMEGDYPAHLS